MAVLKMPRLRFDPAEIVWATFLESWEIPEDVSVRLWRAIARSRHTDCTTLRYGMGQVLALPRGPRREQALVALFTGPAHPQKLVGIFESLRAVGWVSKRDVDAVTSALLTSVSAAGNWQIFDKRKETS